MLLEEEEVMVMVVVVVVVVEEEEEEEEEEEARARATLGGPASRGARESAERGKRYNMAHFNPGRSPNIWETSSESRPQRKLRRIQ